MKNRMQRALADMICRERALDSSGVMGRFDDRAKLLATLVYLVAMLSTPIYRPSQLILFAIFPITMSAASDTDYLRIAPRWPQSSAYSTYSTTAGRQWRSARP